MSTNDETLRSLGKLITDPGAQRDAVHIAVIPVVADSPLAPGSTVSVLDGRAVMEEDPRAAVGVIDPFLPDVVREGQRAWLYLKPGSITDLRHDWTHPAFPEAPERSAILQPVSKDDRERSEAWLRNIVGGALLQQILDHAIDGEPFVFFGIDTPDELSGIDMDVFYRHVENITGRRVDAATRDSFYFSCSC